MFDEESFAVYDENELSKMGYTIEDCRPITIKDTVYYVLKPENRKIKKESTIEYFMYQSGLTADGCWNEMDEYDKQAIFKFVALIVKACADLCDRYQDIPATEPRHCANDIRLQFGVEE